MRPTSIRGDSRPSGRALALAAFALMAVPPPAMAQLVIGELVEEGTSRPIEAAFVLLLDAEGQRQGAVLTDANGRFLLRPPSPGHYRLRAERIGYRTVMSPGLEIAADDTLRYRLVAPGEAIALEGIEVESDRRCAIRPEEGRATARIWEEARKALSVAAWAEGTRYLEHRVIRYERELDPGHLRVQKEQLRPLSSYSSGSPFVSLPAEELAADGYIQESAGQLLTYYAPDAEVLLSDAFLDGHCFRVRTRNPPAPNLIGLAFEPVRRRDVADIQGVLWLDRSTAELRSIEYRYTRPPWNIDTDKIGGHIEFQRIPGGPWIVRRWWIRMPLVAERRVGMDVRTRPYLALIKEAGGDVASTRTSDGTVLIESQFATLGGAVYDSTRAAPLAGATVLLVGTEHATRTDERGRFHLADLPEGRYTVGVTAPRLDSIGVAPLTREVELTRGSLARVRFAIPSLATILAAGCADAPKSAADSAVVVGTVSDAATGVPLAGARVTLDWTMWNMGEDGRMLIVGRRDRGVEATTDGEGAFRACGIPDDVTIRAWATMLGRSTDTASFKLRAGEIHMQDFFVALSPPAVIEGRVLDSETGAAVAGARITLRAAGAAIRRDAREASTDTSGVFRLPDVPEGQYVLAIHHARYDPREKSLEIAGGSVVQLTVDMARGAIALAPIEVEVRSEIAILRRSEGSANVMKIGPADIAAYRERGASRVAEVLKMHRPQGVDVNQTFNYGGDSKWCVQSPRRLKTTPGEVASRCSATKVVIDGLMIDGEEAGRILESLGLDEIVTIEFLPPAEATFRYGTIAGNGAVVITTRQGKPRT